MFCFIAFYDDVAWDWLNLCTTEIRIVANNCLPFGIKVFIKGKSYVVGDRMNSRYGCDHFDILMPDYDSAIRFGRQKEVVHQHEYGDEEQQREISGSYYNP